VKPGNILDNVIDGEQWKEMMLAGARSLERRRREVDALNVFPVPDGDTGTNMHLTIQSAARDAAKVSGKSLSEIASAASMGSLMGARGNSGVILSQLMRGIAKGLEGLAAGNALQVAQALQNGVETAYRAVMKPVEGTILTVARETAKGALSKAKQGATVLETLEEGRRKGLEALAKTPDLLPTLKQAGVVDAGGQGFLAILDGWIGALRGETGPAADSGASERATDEGEAPETARDFTVEFLEYPYCTEFLLKGKALRPEQIRRDLTGRGDCLLVVGEPTIVKIHIHTQNPGQILDYALQWGSLHEVQIHNMLAQNEAMAHARKEQRAGEASARVEERAAEPGSEKELGVVAVAMGQGIAEVFKSLGVDEVVSGGQTMNPSTEDLAAAVERVAAKHVFILPNNGNIVLAARQVKELVADKKVYVVPSKSIPQGIAALLNFNPAGAPEDNLAGMEEGLGQVVSGEVTYAVRDSQYGGIAINAGDVLGLVDDQIVASGKDLLSVTQATLAKMGWRDRDLVTIFYGQDVTQAEAKRVKDWLNRENPQVEVEVHAGGQPLYYYILGVE